VAKIDPVASQNDVALLTLRSLTELDFQLPRELLLFERTFVEERGVLTHQRPAAPYLANVVLRRGLEFDAGVARRRSQHRPDAQHLTSNAPDRRSSADGGNKLADRLAQFQEPGEGLGIATLSGVLNRKFG